MSPIITIELVIHWKGDKHSVLYVRKNRTGEHRYTTDREVVEVVRDLARTLPDAQIARVLNRLGYRTGAGNTWVQTRVNSLRNHNGIASFNPERNGERMVTIGGASKILDVSAPYRSQAGRARPASRPPGGAIRAVGDQP